MQIIAHRINSVDALVSTPNHYGVELDIRSKNNRLIMSHDAFSDGEDFETYARTWAKVKKDQLMIINPKEDGLETRAYEICAQNNITNILFLDLTIPTTIRFAKKMGFNKIAARVSEYESIESAELLKPFCSWIWLDVFSGQAPDKRVIERLKQSFKICLVSPELHSLERPITEEFLKLKNHIDAVCTKRPNIWENA